MKSGKPEKVKDTNLNIVLLIFKITYVPIILKLKNKIKSTKVMCFSGRET